jgi:hypothetical protein
MGNMLSSLVRRTSAPPALGAPGRVGRARTPDNLPFALSARTVEDNELADEYHETSLTPTNLTPSQAPTTPTHDPSPGPSTRPTSAPVLRIGAPADVIEAPRAVAPPEPVHSSAATPPAAREVASPGDDGFPAAASSEEVARKVLLPSDSQGEVAPASVPQIRADASPAATTAKRSNPTIAYPTPEDPRPPAALSSPRLAVLPSPSAAAPPAPRTIDVRIGRVEITAERETSNPIRSAPAWTSEPGRDPFAGDSAARSWTDRSGSWG